MSGNETDGRDGPGHDVADRQRPWHDPLGSTASARRLADLVIDRAGAVIGLEPMIDFDRGLVFSPGRPWSAPLAPLAACVATIPPAGWTTIVDREIRRWSEAATAADRLGGGSSRADGRHHPPRIIRLTDHVTALSRTLRPAFGPVVWELVHDLGAAGLAATRTGRGEPLDEPSERIWHDAATETVDRHRHRWTRLTLRSGRGLVLSGPHVSALLFETGLLRAHAGPPDRSGVLRATVFTNSLLLITDAGTPPHEADVVAASLHRFTSVSARRFEPFTTVVDQGGGRWAV